MLIQTKPKEPGKPVEAVQFLGDPTVHPQIFRSEDKYMRPHWRIGGENHGGPYDSGSMYLSIGDWIIGNGNVVLINKLEFEQNWQIVKESDDTVPAK